MDKKDKVEVGHSQLQYSSSNAMDSVALTGTPRPPFDWVNYSAYNCFKDDEYVHDTQVMRLHIAARDNHTNFIRRSLHKGVSVYLPDAVGRSALHWAAVFCKPDTVEAIIKLFPVSRLDMGDRKGRTPLHYAILAGRADVANMLLKAGCHVHSIDNQGRTPLHYAAQNANVAVLLLLVKRGANPSHLDKFKRSPYDVAKEYHNMERILECLRLETPNTPEGHEKPKPIEPRQKLLPMITKAVETDGKVSITFLSGNNMEEEQSQQSWQTNVLQADEDEEVITDPPVEIVKEEMERDAERMKYKLSKIGMRKEPPTEEKLRKQERALHLLLNRSKKNALEERRKRSAEEERLRRLTQKRTRSPTPKTCFIEQSSLEIRTSTESAMGHFQTSHRPSNASSPTNETKDLGPDAEDEWREETITPCEMDRMEVYTHTPPPIESAIGTFQTSHRSSKASSPKRETEDLGPDAEVEWREEISTRCKMEVYPHTPPMARIETNNNTVEESFERQAAENNTQNADAAVSDHQVAASVKQARAEPENEQKSVNASATNFPAYLHQWFTTAFPSRAAPYVSNLRTRFVSAHVPDTSADTPMVQSPLLKEEQRNSTRSSSPPPLLVDIDYFTAPSDIPGSDMGKTCPFSPQSPLSTSSYKSPSSPHWDASRSVRPRSRNTATGNWTAQCTPVRQVETHVLHLADTFASDHRTRKTEVQPGLQDEHTPVIRHKDPGSYAKMATKNLNKPDDARSHSGSDHSKPNGMFSPDRLSSEPSLEEDTDPFPLLEDAHSCKLPKRPINSPPNRHGPECFSRPKAQGCKVRTSEDHKWQLHHSQSKHPWSPDEPWRPGGISKTVENFKMYGLLKAKRRSSCLHPIHTLHKSKPVNDEEVDSDPFVEVDSQEDKDIDALPLAKAIRQQEALWSLREAPHQSPDRESSPISKPRSMVKNQDGRIISSASTNNLPFQNIPQISTPHHPTYTTMKRPAYLAMTTRTEQGQGMLIAQMPDEQCPQPCNEEAQTQRIQSDSFSHANPSQPSKSTLTHPRNPLEASQTSLQYASFVQQENLRVQPNQSCSSQPKRECSSASVSTQQDPVVSSSTSFLLPQDSFPNSTNPCPTNHMNLELLANWPQQNSGFMSTDGSQPLYNRHDKQVHGESEIGSNPQRERAQKSRSPYSVRRMNSSCSLPRIDYYGQSVRSQFLGLGRERPPVHQCIDVESVCKQWL